MAEAMEAIDEYRKDKMYMLLAVQMLGNLRSLTELLSRQQVRVK